MTTDFKTPKEFLFNHYVANNLVVGDDKLRQALNLIYAERGPFYPNNQIDFDLNQVRLVIAALYDLKQTNDKKFVLSLKDQGEIDIDSISPETTKRLLDFFNEIASEDFRLYEDYNFKPENKTQIGLSVQTVTRELNPLDVLAGSDTLTSGELSNQKQETSLKFSYAFKTIKVDKQTEIVSKETDNATNFTKWQKEALNDSNITNIPRLENIVYLGDQSQEIENQIIGEGSPSDIGIDKVYNVVRITLPPKDPDQKTLLDAMPKLPSLIDVDNVDLTTADKYAAIDYILETTDTDFTTPVATSQKEFRTEDYRDELAPLNSYGYLNQKFIEDNFVLENDDGKKAITQEQLSFETQRLNKFILPSQQESTVIASSNQEYLSYLSQLGIGAFINGAASTPIQFQQFLASSNTAEVGNGTMADVFSTRVSGIGLGDKSFGEKQGNLLREGKLIGLNLFKSTQPLNTQDTGVWSNSIVQSYRIPVELKDDFQELTIFDSQIIYGKQYFYTLTGIYNVNGKQYYYTNPEINKQITKGDQEQIITLGRLLNTPFTNLSTDADLIPSANLPGQFNKNIDTSGEISLILYQGPETKKEQALSDTGLEVGEVEYNIFFYYLVEQNSKQEIVNFELLGAYYQKISGSDIAFAALENNLGIKLEEFVFAGGFVESKITNKYNVFFNFPELGLELKDAKKSKLLLESFRFNIIESNVSRIFEFPLGPSLEVDNIDTIPLPPDVIFVPLADTSDKIKIRFQETTQSDFAIVDRDYAVTSLNGSNYAKIQNKSNEIVKENSLILNNPDQLVARSEGDLSKIHVRKLDRRPDNLEDLIENGEQFILDFINGQTAYISNLKPNQKYYYAFISRDIVGLYSTASSTYEVEIVEDSGFVYTKINVYDYPEVDDKKATKVFQKLLKVKPSFEVELAIPDAVNEPGIPAQLASVFSTVETPNKSIFGPQGQPPRFKIRVRSKKSKRAFDINLKYTMSVKNIETKFVLNQIKQFSELIDEVEIEAE